MKTKIFNVSVLILTGACLISLYASEIVYTKNPDGGFTAMQLFSPSEVTDKLGKIRSQIENVNVQILEHQAKIESLNSELAQLQKDLNDLSQ